MLDRSVPGCPPASTFKLVTTIAGIESGRMTETSKLPTMNSFCYRGRCYGDHGSFGAIGFPMALAVSSNSFYYQVGLKAGPKELLKAVRPRVYAHLNHIQVLGADASGLLGDEAWNSRVYGERSSHGDTL